MFNLAATYAIDLLEVHVHVLFCWCGRFEREVLEVHMSLFGSFNGEQSQQNPTFWPATGEFGAESIWLILKPK